MKQLIIFLFTAILLSSCNYVIIDKNMLESKLKDYINETAEKAYFEGQKDAINNDIRIKLNSDSIYVWTKSPWNSGKQPKFNPTLLESK